VAPCAPEPAAAEPSSAQQGLHGAMEPAAAARKHACGREREPCDRQTRSGREGPVTTGWRRQQKIVENGGSRRRGTSPWEQTKDTHVGEKKRALESDMFFGVRWFRI
jgi:hypothetical protein